MERLDAAGAELRKFVNEQKYWPPFRHLSAPDIAAMRHGLDLIVARINECRGYAKDTEPRLGATRKAHVKEAAENAAIWFLANNMHYTGKPHMREVARLAHAILGKEVSLDRVRHAVRQRNRPILLSSTTPPALISSSTTPPTLKSGAFALLKNLEHAAKHSTISAIMPHRLIEPASATAGTRLPHGAPVLQFPRDRCQTRRKSSASGGNLKLVALK